MASYDCRKHPKYEPEEDGIPKVLCPDCWRHWVHYSDYCKRMATLERTISPYEDTGR